jgi:phosphopantothenate synthetase
MDPDAATIQNRSAVECLVWGGFWVAASDGRIDQVEVEAFSKSIGSRTASEAAIAIRAAAEPLKLIRERFHRSAEGCVIFRRHNVMHSSSS